MSHERHLIDTIKSYFARKSLAQLQEIAQADNHDRWSAEAIAAAGEVLEDRVTGRAQEPQEPEEDRHVLSLPPVPYSLGLIVGFIPVFALNGFRFGSEFAARDRENPDLPMPFGPKMAWLALDTTESEAAVTALGLQDTRPATWAEGIDASTQSSVFVTPPLADWTLAVSSALFPLDRAEAFVKPLLERLSRQFGEAQYFCTHRDIELHAWPRARQGRLLRGYGWLGEKNLTLWDEGTPTKEERELGLRFPAAERGAVPDENSVMQLACLWSIDPTTLDEQFMEPATGLLGKVSWPERRP